MKKGKIKNELTRPRYATGKRASKTCETNNWSI